MLWDNDGQSGEKPLRLEQKPHESVILRSMHHGNYLEHSILEIYSIGKVFVSLCV